MGVVIGDDDIGQPGGALRREHGAAALDASHARTVGATGNLILTSRKSAARLERELEAACAAHYGRATEIVVKEASAWRAMVAANPFVAEAEHTPAHLLLWAMRSPLPDAGLAQLRARAHGEERLVRTAGGDLYMWFGSGEIARSGLPSGFGLRALGTVGTNRNWNTVQRITAALDAAERNRRPPGRNSTARFGMRLARSALGLRHSHRSTHVFSRFGA